jgi:hypothetical protein
MASHVVSSWLRLSAGESNFRFLLLTSFIVADLGGLIVVLSQAPSIEWWVEGTSSLLTSRDLYHVPSYPSFYFCATSLCLRSAKSTLQRSRPPERS